MNKLTINLADFMTAVLAVAPAASKSESRPILTAIHIIVDEETGTVTLEATDSAMALKSQISSFLLDTPQHVTRIDLNLHAKSLADRLKQTVNLKQTYGSEDIIIEWEEDARYATLQLGRFGVATVETIYGEYPRLQSVWKDTDLNEKPDRLMVSIATQLLEKLIASAKSRKREVVTLSFAAKDGGLFMKPFACGYRDEKHGNITGLLTPMRTY